MRFPLFVCAFVFVAMTAPICAQSPNGNINGLVSDLSNAAVHEAEIVAVNDVTGVQYTTKTNAEGIYVLPSLPPGAYRVQVSKIGFKTLIKPDIVLNVQDSLSLNFTLLIGAFHEIVTVEGGAPLVDTENATVSTVVDRQFAENLPMNGRSFQSLIELTPGVVLTPASAYDAGQFSVNGQRAASNYWMVDGVSANVGIGAGQVPGNGVGGTLGSFSAFGGTNSLVSVDAMQEFRIQTSSYAPEFGRTPGGQISIVTRSGTNQFHGTLFDYLRNYSLDANNWFADAAGLEKPREHQNDFGGTLSGPIDKDKSFFFFSYEGLRLRLPETSLTSVPDVAARQNAIAAMRPYLDSFPLPNGPDDQATGIAQFNASYSNPAKLDAYSLRIDHRLSPKWGLFGRYNYSPSEFSDRGASSGYAALSSVQPFRVTTQTGTFGATVIASPVVANDLRFNYSRTDAQSYFYQDGFGGAVPIATLPFPGSITRQNGFFNLYIFSLGVGEIINVGKFAENIQRQVNIVDSLSWQRGSHSFKFGFDYRLLSPIFNPEIYQQGAGFSDVSDSTSGTISYASVSSRKNVTLLFHNLGAFAQDTWHLPRLTFTGGVRWDVDLAPASINGPDIPSVSGYSLTNLSQLAISPPGAPPFKTAYGNVAPRVGVSFQMFHHKEWQTVLKSGAGIFYDLVSSEAGNALGIGAPPFSASSYFYSGMFPFSATQAAPLSIPPSGTLSRFEVFNPNLRLPYTAEWNLTLEQSLGKYQILSASYIGALGRRLLQTTSFFDPPTNPNIGTADFIDNTSRSNYNALQVQFQRRLSRGFQALASYTWSRSMDNASAGSYGNASNAGSPGSFDQNWGPSDFDARNAFTSGLTYDLPTLGDSNAVSRNMLTGWSAEAFIVGRSAQPVDLSDSNFFGFDSSVLANIRPDVIPGQAFYLYSPQYPGGKAFDSTAFTNPPVDPITGNPIRQGDLGRNVLRGFSAFQWDFAIHRDFPVHESVHLQFRAELFNILNHPNFGPPNNQFGASRFGISTQTLAQSLSNGGLGAGGFSPLYQLGGPRSIQLALKLRF